MGGSQSAPRKISVENENAIQVSKEALDRISSQLSTKQAEQSQQQQPQQPYYPPPPPHYYETTKPDYSAEEAYWAKRIDGLKKAHERITTGMKQEYQKTLREASDLFEDTQKDKVISKIPPCQEQKAKIIQCYSENPDKTLACSVVVNEFNDCVCKSRIAAVTAAS